MHLPKIKDKLLNRKFRQNILGIAIIYIYIYISKKKWIKDGIAKEKKPLAKIQRQTLKNVSSFKNKSC